MANHFKWSATFVLALTCLLAASRSEAGPIFPSRGVLIRGDWRSATKDSTEWLDALSGWGSVFHGFNSANDEYGWCVDIGFLVQIARWGLSGSVIAVSDMELTARTNNNVKLNPSGAIWEEGLLYAHNSDDLEWQVGYLNRCRHDIDNGVFGEYLDAPSRRTLIYASFAGRLISKPFQLLPVSNPSSMQTIAWLALDLYPFRSDYRQPDSATNVIPTDRNLLFTIGGNAAITLLKQGSGSAYAQLGIQLSVYGSSGNYFRSYSGLNETTIDARVELGYQFDGNAARFQRHAGWENLQDDETQPIPENSHFTLLGIRLGGTSMIE